MRNERRGNHRHNNHHSNPRSPRSGHRGRPNPPRGTHGNRPNSRRLDRHSHQSPAATRQSRNRADTTAATASHRPSSRCPGGRIHPLLRSSAPPHRRRRNSRGNRPHSNDSKPRSDRRHSSRPRSSRPHSDSAGHSNHPRHSGAHRNNRPATRHDVPSQPKLPRRTRPNAVRLSPPRPTAAAPANPRRRSAPK